MEYTHYLIRILLRKAEEIGVDNIDPKMFIICFNMITNVREPNVEPASNDNLITEKGWIESVNLLRK